MATDVYGTARWRKTARLARKRDGGCVIGRLTGTPCDDTLDGHHIIPLDENGAPYDVANVITLCHSHHPMLEAFRRRMLSVPQRPRCPHRHVTAEARRQCEDRLQRLRTTV